MMFLECAGTHGSQNSHFYMIQLNALGLCKSYEIIPLQLKDLQHSEDICLELISAVFFH